MSFNPGNNFPRRAYRKDYSSNRRFRKYNGKNIPGTGKDASQIFDFGCLKDSATVNHLKEHGRILLFVRGPPGTNKGELCRLLNETYPEAFHLSAKQFKNFGFLKPDSRPEDSKDILKKSHAWCLEMLEMKMQEDHRFIILSNTHVKSWEVEFYLDLIKTYRYSVLMLNTPNKFRINSELLTNSNKQGLKREYFDNRLRTWCVYYPWYTGWFLNPADSDFLVFQGFKVFDLLLEKSTYCLELGLSSKGGKHHFEKEFDVFCICAYCKYNEIRERCNHYNEIKVQDALGKVSPLKVFAYVISTDHILALVRWNEEQRELASLQSSFIHPPGVEDVNYKFKIGAAEMKKVANDDDNDESASVSSTDTIKDLNDVVDIADTNEATDNPNTIANEIEKESKSPGESNEHITQLFQEIQLSNVLLDCDTETVCSDSNDERKEDSESKKIEAEQWDFEEDSENAFSLKFVPSVNSSQMVSYRSFAPSCTETTSEIRNLQEEGIATSDERVIEYVQLNQPIATNSKPTLQKHGAIFKPDWYSESCSAIGMMVLGTHRESCGFVPHYRRPNYYLQKLFDGAKMEGREEIDIGGDCNEGRLFKINNQVEYIFFPKEELIFQSIFNALY